MDIIFTKHAKIRISQRKISEEDVKSAIKTPDAISETFRERLTARKKFAKGTLEVIHKKSEKKIIIITCYWIKEE